MSLDEQTDVLIERASRYGQAYFLNKLYGLWAESGHTHKPLEVHKAFHDAQKFFPELREVADNSKKIPLDEVVGDIEGERPALELFLDTYRDVPFENTKDLLKLYYDCADALKKSPELERNKAQSIGALAETYFFAGARHMIPMFGRNAKANEQHLLQALRLVPFPPSQPDAVVQLMTHFPFTSSWSIIPEKLMRQLIQHEMSAYAFENEEGFDYLQEQLFELTRRYINVAETEDKLSRALETDCLTTWSDLFECLDYSSNEQIFGILGKGLNGTTYLAHSPGFRSHVAIKVVDKDEETRKKLQGFSQSAPGRVESRPGSVDLHYKEKNEWIRKTLAKTRSFTNEIQTLKNLHHENIVHIYYAGNHFVKKDGKPVYAIMMEYVDGPTLEEIMSEQTPPLDPATALDYSAQLLEGIRYLVKEGVFHKDLHPKNVAVNSKGKLKILDFGTAGAPGEDFDSNRRYGGQSDLFSWCLLFYQLHTGEHLVTNREQYESTEHYASRVDVYKKEIFDVWGKVAIPYVNKIRQSMHDLADPLLYALETQEVTEEDIRFIQDELRKKRYNKDATSYPPPGVTR